MNPMVRRSLLFSAGAMLAGGLFFAESAHAAPSTCNGAFQIGYPVGANYPQPVPPGNTGDDILQVQLVLGAGDVANGTKLSVNDVRFDLDCVSGTTGSPSPCTDQGTIIQYEGDGTITTD